MVESRKIGADIKAYFDSVGITQKEVAEKLGVKQATINQLLNGKPFGKNSAQKWHDAFGFNRAWLITGEGKMFADGVVQSINGNSGVAIQQANGGQVSTDGNNDGFFTKLCADLMRQIMERDTRICCLEEENRKLKEMIDGNK